MKSTILLRAALFAAFSSLTLSTVSYSNELKAEHTMGNEEARYPTEVIARPSIMPTSIVGFELNTSMTELKTINMDINSEFGLVKNVHGSVSWDGLAFDTKAQKNTPIVTTKKTVNLGLKYNYLSIPHVSFSTTLKVPLHVKDGEILRNFIVGIPVVFYNDLMAGGILGNLFNLTMRERIETEFNFDWWYGIQAYGNLWFDINSSFGKVALVNKNNVANWESQGFWNVLPVNLRAIYAFNHYFDLGVNAGFTDAKKAKETFMFGVSLTTRAGRIFG